MHDKRDARSCHQASKTNKEATVHIRPAVLCIQPHWSSLTKVSWWSLFLKYEINKPFQNKILSFGVWFWSLQHDGQKVLSEIQIPSKGFQWVSSFLILSPTQLSSLFSLGLYYEVTCQNVLKTTHATTVHITALISVQFMCKQYLSAWETPLCSTSQTFFAHCLWNSSNVGLSDNDFFSSFPERSSSNSSFCTSLLQLWCIWLQSAHW